ncbi:MAG: formate dehydrogenase subunit gamma [Nitrososphaerales archaeon]
MTGAFTGRNVGSIVVYSIISGLGLAWLVTLIIIPMLAMAFEFTLQHIVSLLFDLLITVLVIVAILHNGLNIISQAGRGVKKLEVKEKIKRFSLNQRIQHLGILITVAISAVTGFAQQYYEAWGRAIIVPMGGLQVSMNLHLASAFFMGILVAYHFAFYAASYITKRVRGIPVRLDIMFGRKDVSDFLKNLRYMLGGRERPRFGRYNYMQKFDYWGIYWGILILGVPGVILWIYGNTFLAGLPFIFHTKEAMLAVLWLWLFHIYQTHFNPRKFPVDGVFLTGSLSERDMTEEHPLELERIRAGGETK